MGGDGKRNFFIESLEASDAMKNILSYFQKDRHLKELTRFVMEEYGLTLRKSKLFSDELIERQIIRPELLPNITGRDYCRRVMETIGNESVPVPGKQAIRSLLSPEAMPLDEFMHHIPEVSGMIHKSCGLNAGNALYVNLERDDRPGTISWEVREKITQALCGLEKLVPVYENDSLVKFKNDFEKKFSSRWVPLMIALDPRSASAIVILEKKRVRAI